jgi:hypothetical protein
MLHFQCGQATSAVPGGIGRKETRRSTSFAGEKKLANLIISLLTR